VCTPRGRPSTCEIEFVGELVDADDLDVVVGQGGDHRGHADAPESDDDDGLAGLRPSGVDDRPATGEDGATEQRGDLGRHVSGHRHHGAPVDDGVGGETGDPEMMVDGFAAARQPPFAIHQRARAVGGTTGFARRQPVGGARRTLAAPGQKGHDDALADGHVRDGGPGLLDDSRRLVPKQHRHRANAAAVDHRQIGMAEACRFDADQQFGVAGRREFELAD
jgi:hypothetical protein